MLRLVIRTPRKTRTFATEGDEVLIGRRRGVALPISDPAADRSHCVLRIEGGLVWLVDLGSRRGTYVEGRRIEEATLGIEDRFRIGNTTLTIAAFGRNSGAAAPARPMAAPRVRRTAPAHDFGAELRLMISRAPWYLTCLAVHFVALLLLDLVAFHTVAVDRGERMRASLPGEILGPESLAIDQEPLSPEDLPEDLVEPQELPEPPDAAANTADKSDPFPPAEIDPNLRPEAGVSLGLHGPQPLRRPLPRAPTVPDGGAGIDKGDIGAAHAEAADIVRRSLGGRGILRGISSDRILVLEGNYDHMEGVLRAYAIPFTLVTRNQLLTRSLARTRLLCIDCGKRPYGIEAKKLVARVKEFILAGGWVITSDWSVDPYLTEGFPDRVQRQKPTRRQLDTTIEVEPARGGSPLLEGVFQSRARSEWWLEDTSTFFKVTRGKVHVLIVSRDMKRRYGWRVVAFEFRAGRGRAMHLLGHFYQKDGNKLGLVGMHRLIINFLLERFARR